MRPVLSSCTVTSNNLGFDSPLLADCRVTHSGSRLAIWVRGEHRWERFDMLTDIDLDESGDQFTVSGQSSMLRNEIGLPAGEARVKLTVRPNKGCETCN